MVTIVAALIKESGNKALASFTVEISATDFASSITKDYRTGNPLLLGNVSFPENEIIVANFNRFSTKHPLEKLMLEAQALVPALKKFSDTRIIPLFAYADDGSMYRFHDYKVNNVFHYNEINSWHIVMGLLSSADAQIFSTDDILNNLTMSNPFVEGSFERIAAST